jgi:predicted nucleic acid-binding protein
LRALRADSRIDDRPALADLAVTDPEHVARAAALWAADTSYSWAVCEVTTGELLAQVTLDPATGAIATRARAGHGEAAAAAAESVRRFAAGLGLLETPLQDCRRTPAGVVFDEG